MPRPSPAILTRDAVVEEASRIIDAEGVGALSMRRLAGELGVRGPSLYHHFASKDEILDGIVHAVYERIELSRMPPDWEGILTEYAMQLRGVLLARPNIVEILALRPVTSLAQMRSYEATISRISDCGWTPQFARELCIAAENLVFGSALMASAPDIELTAEQRREFPLLAQTAEGPPPDRPDDGFEIGFAALMAGLRVFADDPAAAPRPLPHQSVPATSSD